MNSERIILANYDNIVEASHYADFLKKEGILCKVEYIDPSNYASAPPRDHGRYLIKVSAEDEFMARFILASDDPWFHPEIQAPIGQQYRLIGAMITFVGSLCSFASLQGSDSSYAWIPLSMTGIGLFIFIRGILKSAEEYSKD